MYFVSMDLNLSVFVLVPFFFVFEKNNVILINFLLFSLLQALSQKTQRLPFGLTKEVFFVNLEYGYFGCQINETTDYLQIYELSKLCDGVSDCFMGSDELRKELKCSSKCQVNFLNDFKKT